MRPFRAFLCLTGCFACVLYQEKGDLTAPDLMACGVMSAAVMPLYLLYHAAWRLLRRKADGLDRVLLTYPTGDTLTLADWHRGISVYGSIGSGKSSGSGLGLARAILRVPNSAGCIFASNPDDGDWWRARFEEAGRPNDLKEFSPTSDLRWNHLAALQKGGADARAMVKHLMSISESLSESRGGDKEPFWRQAQERYLFAAIEAIRQAYGHVDCPSIASFFASAAYSTAQIKEEEWRKGYQCQTMGLLAARTKSVIEAADYQIIKDLFFGEFPSTDDRVRMSVLAGITNTLHALNSGLVRQIVSTTTNASTDDYASGIWHLYNFPVSQFGASGKAIYASAKATIEKWILQRDYRPGDPTVTLWSDEFWHIVNNGDLEFMSEARKHGGTIVALTQSINNYAIALGDSSDKRRAEALTGLFATKIFHAVDLPTGQYASSLCGNAMQTTFNTSMNPPKDLWEQLHGQQLCSGSVHEGMRVVKEPIEFMHGLRTGGKANRMMVDSWIIRSGGSWLNRSNVIWAPWSQK